MLQIQAFGLLYGSALLTLIVMSITGVIFAALTRQVFKVLTSGVHLRSAMTAAFCLVICGFATIYCLLEAGLAIYALCSGAGV